MSDHRAIQLAVERSGLTARIRNVKSLSGGCIHSVSAVTLADGLVVVAKTNDGDSVRMFEEEQHSLEAINRRRQLIAPRPLAVGVFADRAVLLMTYLEPMANHPRDADWAKFGRDLAELHVSDAGPRFGLDQDNHIGSTPQPNSWREDWVEFNAVNRLGYQIALAAENQLLDSDEVKSLDHLVERLDRFIPQRPQPSLIHGDLWSGNALPCVDDSGQSSIGVIDPACSIGDGWADIAMMRLFGGFPTACFDAYQEVIPVPDDLDSRLAVYSLYHVLNHVNIFGRGYADQAMSLAKRLAGSTR